MGTYFLINLHTLSRPFSLSQFNLTPSTVKFNDVPLEKESTQQTPRGSCCWTTTTSSTRVQPFPNLLSFSNALHGTPTGPRSGCTIERPITTVCHHHNLLFTQTNSLADVISSFLLDRPGEKRKKPRTSSPTHDGTTNYDGDSDEEMFCIPHYFYFIFSFYLFIFFL